MPRVTGFGAMQNRLDRVRRSAPLMAQAAAHAAAAKAAEGMRRRADRETGELAASISAGPAALKGDRATAEAASDSDHAADEEFGTRNRAASPFMRPAADEDSAQIVSAAAEAARRELGT